MARAKNVPNDPQRRERIIAATMRILQEEGVTGVRARAVAARAEVPLSSVSYHFPSVRELLLRSEERRVGKECRSGWWGEHGKKENGRTVVEGVTAENETSIQACKDHRVR